MNQFSLRQTRLNAAHFNICNVALDLSPGEPDHQNKCMFLLFMDLLKLSIFLKLSGFKYLGESLLQMLEHWLGIPSTY